MTSQQLEDISYGNLGLGRYDKESKEWHFQRIADNNRTPEIVWCFSEDTRDEVNQGTRPDLASAREREQKISNLVHLQPELAPAASLLGPRSQVSEALESLTTEYDDLSSDLLALGTAVDYNLAKKTPVRIIASVSGVARHLVRLALLQTSFYTWDRYPNLQTGLSVVDTEELAWYSSACTPVHQLCFSGGETSGGFLAVRSLHGTAILRPSWRSRDVFPKSALSNESLKVAYKPRPSLIDPNFILQITLERTAGAFHVHVSFNPWYKRQLALIDSTGCVRTFVLEGPFEKFPWKLKEGPSVQLELPADPQTDDREHSDRRLDSWGFVSWASDETTIVASTRRALQVYLLEDTAITSLKIPNLIGGRESDWILDVARSPVNPSHFFVLTSSRVVWVHIYADAERKARAEHDMCAWVLSSFCHYRNGQDKSMRLAINTLDQETTLLIYSRENGFNIGFTLSYDPEKSVSGCVSNPYLMRLPSKTTSTNSSRSSSELPTRLAIIPLTLCLNPVHNSLISDEPEVVDRKPPRLQQLFSLGPDLKIQSSVFIERSKREHFEAPMPNYAGSSRDDSKKKSSQRASAIVAEAFFIVPDNAVFTDDQNARYMGWRKPFAANGRATVKPFGTADFRLLANEISVQTNNTHQALKRFGSIERIVERSISDKDSTEPGVHILTDCLGNELALDEIDQMSRAILEFLDHVNHLPNNFNQLGDRQLKSLSLSTKQTLRLLQSEAGDACSTLLMPTYENLLNTWVRSLARDVHSNLRVWQERLVRQASMHLFLASYGILPILPSASAVNDGDLATSQRIELALPVRKRALQNEKKGKEPDLRGQSSLETGSLGTSYPGNPVSSSGAASDRLPDSTEALRSIESTGVGSALRQYCNFESFKTLPRSLQKVTDKWELGQDPWNFRWHEQEPGEEAPTEGRRKKAQKRDQTYTGRIQIAESSQAGPSTNPFSGRRRFSPPGTIPENTASQPSYLQVPSSIPSIMGSSQVTQSSEPSKKPSKKVKRAPKPGFG